MSEATKRLEKLSMDSKKRKVDRIQKEECYE
jgi:hypothetical protein